MNQPHLTFTFDEARRRADELWENHSKIGKALDDFVNQYERGPMNLTPDYVRALPEYKRLKGECDVAFAQLRNYNAWYTKKFKKEISAYRQAEREAKLKGE